MQTCDIAGAAEDLETQIIISIYVLCWYWYYKMKGISKCCEVKSEYQKDI
jgi:hypothetical protein